MGRYAKDTGGSNFTPAPAGTHIARCFRLTDIGTHHSENQGKPNVRNQVIVEWELPNELMDVGEEKKPATVSKFYTNSLSEKANLRKDLEAWRGRQFTEDELQKFDLMAILGKPCMVTVIHETKDGKTRAKVTGVTAMPKGLACPPQVNPSSSFWLDDAWDDNKFASLPEGFQKLITQSDEYKQAFSPPPPIKKADDGYDAMARPEETDDIPF